MKLFYQVAITRDADGTITERKVVGASSEPVGRRGLTLEFIYADLMDIDLVKADVDDDGNTIIVLDDDKVAAKDMEDQIKVRMKRIEFGKRLIAIMSIRNDEKGFTTEQVVEFRDTFADIDSALLNGSIGTAMALINAITPDGTVTTDGDKAAMIAEYDANKVALGYE